LYAGDYARAASKSMTDFPLRFAHSSREQNPMTSALSRAPDVRRQEAA
jgi:hypothetical protein